MAGGPGPRARPAWGRHYDRVPTARQRGTTLTVATKQHPSRFPGLGGVRARVALLGTATLLILVASVFGVLRFVAEERTRELDGWAARLGLIADSRGAAVSEWVERQFVAVESLARNPSLQLHMTTLEANRGRVQDARLATALAAEAEYLRNLLLVEADRNGFRGPVLGPEVAADVRRVGLGGLALVTLTGEPVLATPEMPPVLGPLKDMLLGLGRGRRGLVDLHLDPAGQPAMAFAAPVYAVQRDGEAEGQIGFVVGVKQVGRELYPLLRQPGLADETAETLLVRPMAATLDYLSPRNDGADALERSLPKSGIDAAAEFAAATPGGFAVLRDYRGKEVLVTGRAIAGVPWTLVFKVDRAEALAASDERLTRMLGLLFLAIALVAASMVAVWRHGSSVRAARAAARYRQLALQHENQGKLLRLVTDNQPAAIIILDENERYRFANRQAAADAGLDEADLIGKRVDQVLGPETARRLTGADAPTQANGGSRSLIHRLRAGEEERLLRVDQFGLPAEPELGRGLLVIERDITPEVAEAERRERTLSALIGTLVGVIDRRDPFAHNHSTKVAAVARAIAGEMELDESDRATAEMAATLLNLGKVFIPPELLARRGPLTSAEVGEVRLSLQASADLLAAVEFDGPVVATLRQAFEHWDGSGHPEGLADEDILVTARIVAVANAFVGIVSSRAHRPAMSVDQAVESLLDAAGRIYDRRVVVALINHLDNHGGRGRWADLSQRLSAVNG